MVDMVTPDDLDALIEDLAQGDPDIRDRINAVLQRRRGEDAETKASYQQGWHDGTLAALQQPDKDRARARDHWNLLVKIGNEHEQLRSLAREALQDGPWAGDRDGYSWCWFCDGNGAWKQAEVEHESDCVYLRLEAALGDDYDEMYLPGAPHGNDGSSDV